MKKQLIVHIDFEMLKSRNIPDTSTKAKVDIYTKNNSNKI